MWPGFTNWQTDDYFRSVVPEEPYIVSPAELHVKAPADASSVIIQSFLFSTY